MEDNQNLRQYSALSLVSSYRIISSDCTDNTVRSSCTATSRVVMRLGEPSLDNAWVHNIIGCCRAENPFRDIQIEIVN